MRVLLLAPPGAGKGTQGTRIADEFGVPHISTGDLLREHVAQRTPIGIEVQSFVDRGELVPDRVVMEMLRGQLTEARRAGGYVLDGFPRTLEQAYAGYEMGRELEVTADAVIHLEADDEELVRRLLQRALIEKRADDTEEVIRRRLDLYHSVTAPIVGYYQRREILHVVDAMQPPDTVTEQIFSALRGLGVVRLPEPGKGAPASQAC